MFERFTDEARRVVVLSQEEARSLGHAQIGTEHLLLGLVHEQRSEVTGVLVELGVDVRAVQHAVRAVVGRGAGPSPSHLPFSRQAKKSLELALRECMQLGDREIRPIHIMLGLLRVGDGVAVTVLTRQGVELEDVRLIAKRPPESAAPPERSAPSGHRRGLRRWFRWEDDEPGSQPPLLLEQLDDAAWEAVTHARTVARARGAGVVDALDILIGVASVAGQGAHALASVELDARTLAAVERAPEPEPESPSGPRAALAFSSEVRAALRWASDEPVRHGHTAAGTEHLLLGLLEVDAADDLTGQVLLATGASREVLLAELAGRLA
jgi:ATP-dependent Clp protease ATP-binding subunit ClpA